MDFGIYIVNAFDTGKAAKALRFPGGHSLRNVLQRIYGVSKKVEISAADWTQRSDRTRKRDVCMPSACVLHVHENELLLHGILQRLGRRTLSWGLAIATSLCADVLFFLCRPLPHEMLDYAVTDVMYLLRLYHRFGQQLRRQALQVRFPHFILTCRYKYIYIYIYIYIIYMPSFTCPHVAVLLQRYTCPQCLCVSACQTHWNGGQTRPP